MASIYNLVCTYRIDYLDRNEDNGSKEEKYEERIKRIKQYRPKGRYFVKQGRKCFLQNH